MNELKGWPFKTLEGNNSIPSGGGPGPGPDPRPG